MKSIKKWWKNSGKLIKIYLIVGIIVTIGIISGSISNYDDDRITVTDNYFQLKKEIRHTVLQPLHYWMIV